MIEQRHIWPNHMDRWKSISTWAATLFSPQKKNDAYYMLRCRCVTDYCAEQVRSHKTSALFRFIHHTESSFPWKDVLKASMVTVENAGTRVCKDLQYCLWTETFECSFLIGVKDDAIWFIWFDDDKKGNTCQTHVMVKVGLRGSI